MFTLCWPNLSRGRMLGFVALALFFAACGGGARGGAMVTPPPPPTAPLITSQPSPATVMAGLTATFSVGATGTAPLAYQWCRNGSTLAGTASASYTTSATVIADTGSIFSVVVSNSLGSITSSGAGLTVTAPGSVAGALPSGMPSHLAVGLFEGTGATWMKNSGAAWDARYCYFTKGWLTTGDGEPMTVPGAKPTCRSALHKSTYPSSITTR